MGKNKSKVAKSFQEMDSILPKKSVAQIDELGKLPNISGSDITKDINELSKELMFEEKHKGFYNPNAKKGDVKVTKYDKGKPSQINYFAASTGNSSYEVKETKTFSEQTKDKASKEKMSKAAGEKVVKRAINAKQKKGELPRTNEANTARGKVVIEDYVAPDSEATTASNNHAYQEYEANRDKPQKTSDKSKPATEVKTKAKQLANKEKDKAKRKEKGKRMLEAEKKSKGNKTKPASKPSNKPARTKRQAPAKARASAKPAQKPAQAPQTSPPPSTPKPTPAPSKSVPVKAMIQQPVEVKPGLNLIGQPQGKSFSSTYTYDKSTNSYNSPNKPSVVSSKRNITSDLYRETKPMPEWKPTPGTAQAERAQILSRAEQMKNSAAIVAESNATKKTIVTQGLKAAGKRMTKPLAALGSLVGWVSAGYMAKDIGSAILEANRESKKIRSDPNLRFQEDYPLPPEYMSALEAEEAKKRR